MKTIEILFEGKTYTLEVFSSRIEDKNVYTVLVEDPELIPHTGRVISYLSDATSPLQAVLFSSEKTPFKGRLKAAIARAIEKKVKTAPQNG